MRRTGSGSACGPPPGANAGECRGALAAAGAAVLVVALAAIGLWQWAPWRDGGEGGDLGGVPRTGPWQRSRRRCPPTSATTGRLVIGVNVPYAPNGFKDAGGQIVGFDVELMNAVARRWGWCPSTARPPFDAIIPSVRGRDFNVGMSSFTDTKEREASVDFVTYFQAGTLWAKPRGPRANPKSPCGLKVGVAKATLQETEEYPAKSDACVAAGQAPMDNVVSFSQDELTNALINGEVDAMSADSPVTRVRDQDSAAANWRRRARSSTPRPTAGRCPRGRGWRSRCGWRWST